MSSHLTHDNINGFQLYPTAQSMGQILGNFTYEWKFQLYLPSCLIED
jgi:hypothetical protein